MDAPHVSILNGLIVGDMCNAQDPSDNDCTSIAYTVSEKLLEELILQCLQRHSGNISIAMPCHKSPSRDVYSDNHQPNGAAGLARA